MRGERVARKYHGRTFVRETAYVCGNYMDADIYPVFQQPGSRRSRSRPTSAIQERLNQRNAERKFARLANLNFGEGDYALHLTYAETPESAEDAVRLVRNYIRRINRRRKKAGLESCRYLLTTERGKKSGRIHHHLIISGGLSRDEMEEVWGRGRANCLRLQFDRDSGITGLSMYITKDRAMYKRWSGSRAAISASRSRPSAVSQGRYLPLAMRPHLRRGQIVLHAAIMSCWPPSLPSTLFSICDKKRRPPFWKAS